MKRNPFFLKTYFLFALIAIALASFLYIQDIIFKLQEKSLMQTRIFARFSSNISNQQSMDEIIFEEIIKKINFPVIVTDTSNIPIAWRNIGKYDAYFTDELSEKDLAEIRRIINKLDLEKKPIEIKYQDKVLAIVHYGEDPLHKRMQFAPFFQLIFSIVFLFLGIYGYMFYRKSQENFIWAGMARETAHQIGTPLSSLYGWLEIMKNKKLDEKIIQGIDEDVERLNVIAKRFNKIGSPLDKEFIDINEEIKGIVEYFKKRVPSKGIYKIEFKFELCEKCFAPIDRELFKWSIENIVKNSIDALKGIKNGQISIQTIHNDKEIRIKFIDNGRGIEKKNQDKVFDAGFSTKQHGWGIGLTLAKKIIEEFHDGRLYIESSFIEKGSTIVVILKSGRIR